MLWLTCNATQKIGADYNKKTASKGSYCAENYVDSKMRRSLSHRLHMPYYQL